MVYSYNSGSWEEQAGVEVVALDPESGLELRDEDVVFGASVEAALEERSGFALATPRAPADACVAAEMQRVLSWLPAPDAAESEAMVRAFSWLSTMSSWSADRSSLSLASWWARTTLKSGAQMRPGISWLQTRPLSAMEKRAEKALASRMHEHAMTPRAPGMPAESPLWPFGVGLKVVADDHGVYSVSGVAPHSAAAQCGQIQVVGLVSDASKSGCLDLCPSSSCAVPGSSRCAASCLLSPFSFLPASRFLAQPDLTCCKSRWATFFIPSMVTTSPARCIALRL